MGVIDFVSEHDRACRKLPDSEASAHVIQHGLQGLIVQNIKREPMEENDLSHIL